MAKRMLIMLTTVAVLIAALGFVKFRQIQAAIAQGKSYSPPPEAVTTITTTEDSWPVTLGAIGTVTATQGVMVSADLPGQIAAVEFESGERVHTGDVLVRLDTRQETAQLAAAQAQQRLTSVNLERMRVLREKQVVSQAEYDGVEADAQEADARVKEIEATIDRKTIRAPFDGVLGIRQINLGEYVDAGQGIVPLQSLDRVYVDFSVPQQEMKDIHVGGELDIRLEGTDGIAAKGKITAVNSVVNPSTRNVHVQGSFPNSKGLLLPGMFVEASVIVDSDLPVIALPASSIQYTPYGDFVFIVETMQSDNGQSYLGVRQQIVKLGSSRGDQIAIREGVKPGEEVVTSGVFKLRSGAAVEVANDIQPGNSPTPDPEDS